MFKRYDLTLSFSDITLIQVALDREREHCNHLLSQLGSQHKDASYLSDKVDRCDMLSHMLLTTGDFLIDDEVENESD